MFRNRRQSRLARGAVAGAAGLLAVGIAACSSGSTGSGTGAPSSSQSSGSTTALPGSFGSVPAEASGTQHAGTISVAAPPNSAPTWIMPLVTGAANSVFTVPEFDYQMFRPLYWFTNGTQPKEDPAMSLANDPVWSNGDKSVTFTLKSNYKWSDGQPITSQDVLFWYYQLKAALKESPANWAYYTPNLGIPDQVASISAPNASTVTIDLKTAVNPTWFLEDAIGVIQPMPAQTFDVDAAGGKPITDWATNPADATKIYNYLTTASKSVSTYATNPLWQTIDGPYKLASFNATSGAFTLAPNAAYGGPHATTESTVQFVPFTSDAAEFNAIKAGTVDVGYLPLTDVPQSNSVSSSYNEFGYGSWSWSYVTYNFKDTTGNFNNIIDKLYIRQALAHLEDEPGYVKAFFYGAGAQGFGPVPATPVSPYAPSNAATNPYPFSTAAAAALLKANGWTVVPNGTDTCAKPGTGAGECGAGIPAGQKLEWNLIWNTSPSVIGEQVQDWASQAKTVGITMNLSSSNFNYMTTNYNDPSSPKTINKWAMQDFGGETNSTYPTTFSLFNTGGSNQIGDYSNPTADKLINDSITSSDPAAVKSEAQCLTTDQPSMFEPNNDYTWAWKTNLSAQKPEAWSSLTQYYANPEFWYFNS